jgi:hypothetical protein
MEAKLGSKAEGKAGQQSLGQSRAIKLCNKAGGKARGQAVQQSWGQSWAAKLWGKAGQQSWAAKLGNKACGEAWQQSWAANLGGEARQQSLGQSWAAKLGQQSWAAKLGLVVSTLGVLLVFLVLYLLESFRRSLLAETRFTFNAIAGLLLSRLRRAPAGLGG